MFQLSLTEIFVEAYSYYDFHQNKYQQQSLPFNRIYKSKVMSHVSSPPTMWILTCSSRRNSYSLSEASCFSCRQIFLDFSIQIMLLYTLNFKGKHRIGIEWIQGILLVKRSGNINMKTNDNLSQFYLAMTAQANKSHSFSCILRLLDDLCSFEESWHTAECFRSCKPQRHIWWMWVGF